jgi:threonine dehydrogenase-like Zn-dependent dehydrogenase
MAETMRGLWLEEGELTLRDDLPLPRIEGGEALVRVLRAGICNTDLELVRGYYPFNGILGHEFVGVVERARDRPELEQRRVVGEINAVCHRCAACRKGRSSHCERRTVLGIQGRHGAFAEYLTLPAENLHPLPEGISTDAATFVEPLAAALRIREQLDMGPGERVVVIGDGKLGQLVARSLVPTGCKLLSIGRHESKLALARAAGIEAGTEELIAAGEFDVAVECTGNSSGFALARRALRPQGTLVLKSTYAGDLTFDVSSVVVDEITLVGSRCGPFPPAIAMLAAGEVDPMPLVSARYWLADALTAFDYAGRKGTLKVLVDVGQEDVRS